jgi:hypothetical protein
MRIIIRREDDFLTQQYCLLEFKGKFESDRMDNMKSLVHLGTLHRIGEEEYRLEIGVMDLVGKATKLEENQLYTITIDGS